MSLGGGKSIEVNLIAPLGISFFTFQAVGYLFDVYYQRTKAEHKWWDYMLFVCFFPQILSGPISKASELLPQIKANRTFNHAQAVQGLKWLLWGMFLKTVFADRLGIYVDTIYNNYEHMSGLSCMIGCALYSFQIYGDFAGYSFMAVGVGQLLGFDYDYSPLEGHITYHVNPPALNESFDVDSLKLSLFEHMMRQCKQDGILLVIKISPWYQGVDDSEYGPIIALCKKHDIQILNHYKDKDLNFNEKLFKDASHLNVEGVKVFDERVCNELEKLI